VATCAEVNVRPFLLDLRAFNALGAVDRAVAERIMEREAILGRAAIVAELSGADASEAATFSSLCRRLAAVVFGISEEPVSAGGQVIRHRMARPGRDAQHRAWKTALSPHANAVNGELDLVTAQFDLDPGAIRRAVETARSRAARRDGADRGTILAVDIWEACRESVSLSLADLGVRLTGDYGWDDIVLTRESSGQLHELADQVRHRSEVYDRWGFVAPGGRGRGISALFAGPTGTGKTMAAEIVARDLALDLFRIDLSGIVSKYIGETEKNLRRVFDAAERSGAVLFFDEADALFGKRTEIRDSHDRYANIEVNYLLQRMEEYAGLAILATNRRAALDSAFLRRLRFIVEFPFPTPEQRRDIWSRVFPRPAAMSPLDLGFLSRLELSGGNIRGIALNAAFIAAAARAPIGMVHVLKAVAREYAKLERPITPGEFGSYYEEVRA
jgi:SpoVK/Ycf46/Vps4 family AAA+-type ATPase